MQRTSCIATKILTGHCILQVCGWLGVLLPQSVIQPGFGVGNTSHIAIAVSKYCVNNAEEANFYRFVPRHQLILWVLLKNVPNLVEL